MNNGLSFRTLRAANLARIPQFRDAQGNLCHSEPDGSDWSSAEWLQAVVGELGELANELKKIKRGDYSGDELGDARIRVRKEFADVMIYLDIWALQHKVDLSDAIRQKFNEVSRRVSADVYLSYTDDDFHRYEIDPALAFQKGVDEMTREGLTYYGQS